MKKTILILTIVLLTCMCWAEKPFILGSQEGEGEIFFPTQIEEGPNGNIYIYDARLAVIKVFSPNGKFLRKMGRKGQGPGEFLRTSGVFFNFTHDKKLLYFSEFFSGHKWITFMELNGNFHSVLKLKIKRNFAIIKAIHLSNGHFLAHVGFLNQPRKKKDYFLYSFPTVLVIIDSQGAIDKEILKTEHVGAISSIGDGADIGIPYVPLFQWILLKNNTVVFTEGLKNSLDIYNFKGKICGQIKTPLPKPQPVTTKDLENWKEFKKNRLDKNWFNRFGKVIYKYTNSIYEFKPNLEELSSTPANHLFIEGIMNESSQLTPYWLLNTKGEILKKIEISSPIYKLKISEHFIFASTRDEDENLMILCFKRKGSEAEDLEQVSQYKQN